MSLTPGTRVAHYEVVDSLGVGGMGEVYRARDTKLDRDVALKVLPTDFTRDADRLARFEREAKILASLNHPNIATIHGLEEAPTSAGRNQALVLELVEGLTLQERITTGPLPLAEAVDIAIQIAVGLEAAHDQGIIHRDLKPANIKVTPDGRVKILDFGLARTEVRPGSTATTMDAPETRLAPDTVAGTREGTVLGTAPYMSPEQARGQPLDKRTDIWAFGCVVFEMLTGQPAFQGDTVPDTVVRVLDRDPDWSLLPGQMPSRVGDVVRRCLQKDAQRRCRDVADARLELEESRTPPPEPSGAHEAGSWSPEAPPGRWGWGWGWTWPAVATAAVAMAGALWLSALGTDAPIDSVAVLPFENASEAPDGEYLSDGITENLINRLSTLPDLRVIPRGVAYAHQGRTDLQAIGAELGIRAVVTGRVTERDGTLIVRAELTDLGDVAQLWGEQYTRPMTDLLAVEEDLVRQISSELRLRISPDEEAQLTRRETENAEAYALFLKSRHHNLSITREGFELGLQYAREAVDLDPSYGLAWAALADAWVARTFVGLETREEGYARARAAAERAVELDSVNAYPRLMMGFIKHHADWDWEGSIVDFERALELDPSSSDAHQSYSEALASLGRLAEAVEHAERAVELDPLFPNIVNWLGQTYSQTGRHEDALAAYENALELQPGHRFALQGRIGALTQLGRYDEALARLTALIEAEGGDPNRSPALAGLLARMGRTEEAEAILAGLVVDDLASFQLMSFAQAMALTGDMDRAFQALNRLYDRRSQALLWLPYGANNKVFRDDPRFDELVRRMNFNP